MNTFKKLIKNVSVLFIGNFVAYIISFFYVMYSARYLGAENYGVLSFALAFSGVLALIVDLGLNSLIVRELARDKLLINKYVINIILIKLILSVLTLSLLYLILNLFMFLETTKLIVLIITTFYIIGSFSQIFYSVFQAFEKMEYQALGQILNSFLMLMGILFVIFNKGTVLNVAIVYLLVSIVIFMYYLSIYLKKYSWPSLNLDLNFWKSSLMKSIPLSLSTIFSLIIYRADTIILSIYSGTFAIGVYAASYNLIDVLIVIPSIFTISIYPVLSKLHVSSKESFKISYKLSFKYLLILGLPIAVGTTLLAEQIIMLIYGLGFKKSIISLQILIWSIPLMFLTYLLRTTLVSMDKQVLLSKILIITLIANITLNLIIIPSFSYVGAAAVTVITEFISFCLCYSYISKIMGVKLKLINNILKPVTASIIMGLFIIYFKNNLFLVILISIIIYFGILIVLKTFSTDELNLIKKLFNN